MRQIRKQLRRRGILRMAGALTAIFSCMSIAAVPATAAESTVSDGWARSGVADYAVSDGWAAAAQIGKDRVSDDGWIVAAHAEQIVAQRERDLTSSLQIAQQEPQPTSPTSSPLDEVLVVAALISAFLLGGGAALLFDRHRAASAH